MERAPVSLFCESDAVSVKLSVWKGVAVRFVSVLDFSSDAVPTETEELLESVWVG